ncbi:hypothetical protein GCM10018980_20260 [Streptomyces capoamus]|uniref:Uncharacterized protein n=1 Tax=Streptomyces capoamus TaxID=68183 RepID=A0A919C2T4_9ACTN|nr:hypothetical protein GCM10010501_33850 [Streptomyces libani subsp. rufus]GHG43348.1 hypothetical protein GCM10018980_20260 [Streptomyces capoamus]
MSHSRTAPSASKSAGTAGTGVPARVPALSDWPGAGRTLRVPVAFHAPDPGTVLPRVPPQAGTGIAAVVCSASRGRRRTNNRRTKPVPAGRHPWGGPCGRHAAVLVGYTRPEQIAENLSSVGAPLTDDDLTSSSETAPTQQAGMYSSDPECGGYAGHAHRTPEARRPKGEVVSCSL